MTRAGYSFGSANSCTIMAVQRSLFVHLPQNKLMIISKDKILQEDLASERHRSPSLRISSVIARALA